MDVRVGDMILTKKPHPCGESAFHVLRVGADFRIRCAKCGREVMVARSKIEKNIKKIVRDGQTLLRVQDVRKNPQNTERRMHRCLKNYRLCASASRRSVCVFRRRASRPTRRSTAR